MPSSLLRSSRYSIRVPGRVDPSLAGPARAGRPDQGGRVAGRGLAQRLRWHRRPAPSLDLTSLRLGESMHRQVQSPPLGTIDPDLNDLDPTRLHAQQFAEVVKIFDLTWLTSGRFGLEVVLG